MKLIKKYEQFLLEEFKVGNIDISNMDRYLEEMSKGLSDKLFFLNMIDLDILIDFGSADGQILNYISNVKPKIKLIGYDIDEKMIEHSRKKYPKVKFESDWDIVNKIIEENKHLKIGILLSSVIHEVYSYSGGKIIKKFWEEQVFNKNIDYVIIRDMMPSSRFEKMNMIDIQKIKEKSNPKYLMEFEEEWGDISNNFRTTLHWLLKYRYIDNWNRELKENYLPLTLDFFKNKWIPNTWSIQYEDNYTYDYIRKQVKKDFDVDLTEPTHIKMIIQNNHKNN